jgi:Flp pilus assembly protein TadD
MTALIFLLALAQQSAPELAASGARHLEANRVPEAQTAFEQSLKLNPAVFEALSGLGYIYYSQQRFAEARKLLEKAITIRPASFQSHFLLGATLVELKDSPAAIRVLRQAVRIDPAHADARKLLAAEHVGLKQFTEAIRTLAPLKSGEDEEIVLLLIEARQGAGDTAGAFALAQEAAQRFPRSAQVAAWLGFQLQFAGRYDEAEKALREAIRLDPAFPIPYQLLGEVYLQKDSFTEAKTWLVQAADRMPEDPDVLLSLSRAVAGTGDLAAAVDILKRIRPADARVHLQLSRLYFRLGDTASAEAEAELVKTSETAAAVSPWRKR